MREFHRLRTPPSRGASARPVACGGPPRPTLPGFMAHFTLHDHGENQRSATDTGALIGRPLSMSKTNRAGARRWRMASTLGGDVCVCVWDEAGGAGKWGRSGRGECVHSELS